VLQESAPGQLIPVTIVLREQVLIGELASLRGALPKPELRALAIDRLRRVAAGSQAGLLAMLEARGAANVRPLWVHNVICAEVTPQVVRELAIRDDVGYVHREVRLPLEEVLLGSTVPVAGGDPTCGVELVQAPQVWEQRGINGTGVVVGVIDTGVCITHTDIEKRLWTNTLEVPGNGIDDDANGYVDDIRGWNFDAGNGDVNDTGGGHGSHVAGTVAGDGTLGTACGVAPGARIMVLKPNMTFSGEASVWECMQYGLQNGADILTASLGWPHNQNPDRATWRAVCENTIAAGVTVIYAAGNEGRGSAPDNVRTPGDVPDVLTVGAVDCTDQITGFSSRGPVTWENVPPYNDHPYPPGYKKPDVVAEGAATISHKLCQGYTGAWAGTSMATPHVAGAAALLLQADPTLDHFAVKQILESTAVHLGSPGKNNRYGNGRIDALAAVDVALTAGNHCAAKLNSCGTLPGIWTDGDASASRPFGFTVSATNMVQSSVALLIYSDQGGADTPLLGGSLCLATVNRTVPVVVPGAPGECGGLATIDMNAFAAGALGGTPAGFLQVPGTTVHAQFWARDSQGSFGALLTGAASYCVGP